MDTHDKAHYGIAAAMGAALLAVGSFAVGDHSKVSSVASHEWPELTTEQRTDLAARLAALPVHDVTVYCASNCGTMPDDLSEAFAAAGWKSHIESVLASNVSGLFVGPNNDEGKAVAAVIGDVLRIKPSVGDQDGPDVYTVTVGRKGR